MNFLERLEYQKRQSEYIKLISIPKTGSSSINFVLQDRITNPVTLKDNEVNICTKSPNVINVITIRDPLERFISCYSHWKYGNSSSSIFEQDKSEFSECTIFDFIKKIKNESKLKSPSLLSTDYRPQIFWLNNCYKNTLALIYRQDWSEIISDLNKFFYIPNDRLITDIPFLNQSLFKEKFSQEEIIKIKEFVVEFYSEDYNIFDNLNKFRLAI